MIQAEMLKTAPDRILIIAMRYLGDVLLTTPLIHSVRKAYPKSRLDVLVFANTAAILEGNSDIDSIIQTRQGASFFEFVRLFFKIFRKYDLVLITQTGDRPFFYSLLAAPVRVGTVPSAKHTGSWKRFFIQHWSEFDNTDTHTVREHLKLAELMGIASLTELIPPRGLRELDHSVAEIGKFPYAVLHMYPQWIYKRWTVQGWAAVGRFLEQQKIRLVLSGGPDPEEIEYLNEIQRDLPENTVNLAGRVSIAELAGIIRGASLFIGPDTGITHLAAATGIPVIALYGPSNPVKWAPWPAGFNGRDNPFSRRGSQDVNNIHLIQGELDCVPCHLEGCERHRASHSECLDSLAANRVVAKIREILGACRT
ncbi:MAG: glycosyltransferase family 9 protein [Methylococcales bacterium]